MRDSGSPLTPEAAEFALVWRGPFSNEEVEGLSGTAPTPPAHDWPTKVERHSLGWATLRHEGVLVGFVNLAWDGGDHAFLLDPKVAPSWRRQGLATRLVAETARRAAEAGCEWLHVDFDPHLRSFYFEACGFRPTDAGLIRLLPS